MISRQSEMSPMETDSARKGRTTSEVISHLCLSHTCRRSDRLPQKVPQLDVSSGWHVCGSGCRTTDYLKNNLTVFISLGAPQEYDGEMAIFQYNTLI